MSVITNQSQFSISSSHIDLIHGGRMIKIDDESVEGISTRVLRVDNWTESSPGRRTVNIEFRDEAGNLLNASIEAPVPTGVTDNLAEYVRRVSHHACHNSLNELVENETVQRNGFTINDQGLMLAASGETLCCGLFDISAIDSAGDRTIIWTDDVSPAAILRMDDANALTLGKILPKLTQENDLETPRLIGLVATQSLAGSTIAGAKAIAMFVGVVFGVLGAIASKLAVHGPMNFDFSWILLIGVPIAAAIAAFVYRQFGGMPRLAVFRTGLCISRKKHTDEVEWDDLQSITVTDQEVNIGTAKQPRYVTYYTLHIRTYKSYSFGKKLKLSWPENESTMTCTEYLLDRTKRTAFDPLNQVPSVELQPASAV